MEPANQGPIDESGDGVVLGIAVFGCVASVVAVAISVTIALNIPTKCDCPRVLPCSCDKKPTPTPAPCCKADECRQELAKVDARFGGVWDELVEVQEQLAKVKPCGCGPVKECCCGPAKPCHCEPSKPCDCSDKPACECKPQQTIKLPVHRVLKRCK